MPQEFVPASDPSDVVALERAPHLPFLSPMLRAAIAVQDGWPVLDRFFRSTVPTVLFVGYAAEDRFGALSRFVLGTSFTAARVREALDA